MKKIILSVLVLLFALTVVVAQGAKEDANFQALLGQQNTDVRVVALKGPTGMGLVSLMYESEKGPINGNSYTFNLIGNVSEVTPMLVKGEVDIAAVPANLASVIYNNTKGQVQVIAVNTLGVLYLVGNDEPITDIQTLNGKTIYASGKGATPEYALMYLLSQSGLEVGKDVKVEWKSEHAECVAALLNDNNGIAMLPQPFVTTALMKNEKLKVILDLNDAWQYLAKDSALITGVLVARTSFVNEHQASLDSFLADYAKSTSFANTNVEEAAGLVEKYGIVTKAVAQKALPACQIVCVTGEKMKTDLSGYLKVLFDQNPKSIGGQVPGDAFYYVK